MTDMHFPTSADHYSPSTHWSDYRLKLQSVSINAMIHNPWLPTRHCCIYGSQVGVGEIEEGWRETGFKSPCRLWWHTKMAEPPPANHLVRPLLDLIGCVPFDFAWIMMVEVLYMIASISTNLCCHGCGKSGGYRLQKRYHFFKKYVGFKRLL